ncbi:multidrug efflux SMR transporter [Paenibacillus sp. FSL H7-0331]|uniref:DMT family transporter n=1 Tax=Paenibacillus sp. FSL H7-0331 TaxID=1920421 RepID=UPI00096FB605|nr:multidrug efflux SMR transporter [Paenibacillus sp. FSL H7-0331]OME92534.1 QacE family quaternary ammonium compound efflux SMR transporter [Paenibacillus sp. FSL H7-0331]
MAYLFLAISIIGELIGTSMLKASQGFTKLYPTLFTIVAFVTSFYFISLALKTLPLNMTYAIWSGVGAVATALISVLIWKEKINTGSVVGIALIVIGVVVLNLFGAGHGEEKGATESASSIVQNK